jgi:acetoin:2,6-dichlorophenolindophenol oxidoreductase subunit beta
LGADIIVKMDADDQMDPDYLLPLIAPILSGEADYTKSNRFLRMRELHAMPAVRWVSKDVAVIAIGRMLPKALEAAETLAGEGIEVVDPRTLVPLDRETLLASVRKTSRVIVAHEAHKRLGPGAAIAALIAEDAIGYLDGPVVRVAARNVPLPCSPELENNVLPRTQDIIKAARGLVMYRL